jgi:hypothetical protein
MIETVKINLYNNLYEWIMDEFDLDFLNESGYEKDNIVRVTGEYIIECSDAKNWPVVYDTKVGTIENIVHNDVEYILIGGQDQIPVYIPDDGDSGDVYLIYFDNNKQGFYKAICKTEEDSVEWIKNRVESRIKKLADKARAWSPEDDVHDLANYLNKIESIIEMYENELPGFIDDMDYYIDVTGLPVAKNLDDKFQSINDPAWACDNNGDVLLIDHDRGTDDQWYVRDLDELIEEKYGDNEEA